MGPNVSSQPYPKGRGSLRRRLTCQVAMLAALGLGGITAFSAVQMRQMLIGSHQRTLNLVAERFSQDVEKYSARSPFPRSLELAIAQVPSDDVLLWVSHPQQGVLIRSDAATADSMTLKMLSPKIEMPSRSKLIRVNAEQFPPRPADPRQEPGWGDRYLLVCGIPLLPNADAAISVRSGSNSSALQSELYLAYDVTREHQQYVYTVKGLAAANFLLLLLLTGAIAYCVRQTTEPLNRISNLARQISAEELNSTRLEIQEAPAEIAGLVETFNDMLQRLSLAWTKQRQFVNDASHELRTPLAIVHGYLQSVLRRQGSLNELQKEALGTAAEETQRTIHMLEDMLAIARAENGQLEFDLQPTPIQPLLCEIAAQIESCYQRTIQLHLPPPLITAMIDIPSFRRVITNLLDNAAKYSEAGDAIELSLNTRGEQVLIEVSDRGIGIAPEQLNCVFERFYRADEARNRKGGTGLGLSLVKTLVQGMGGQITVRSKLRKGSTFSIKLPLSPRDQSEP